MKWNYIYYLTNFTYFFSFVFAICNQILCYFLHVWYFVSWTHCTFGPEIAHVMTFFNALSNFIQWILTMTKEQWTTEFCPYEHLASVTVLFAHFFFFFEFFIWFSSVLEFMFIFCGFFVWICSESMKIGCFSIIMYIFDSVLPMRFDDGLVSYDHRSK